jgi:hypothetical protein
MSFCTAVNCMDGRTQKPVAKYLSERFGVEYVDMVTEAGPVRAVADRLDGALSGGVMQRVALSVEEHRSAGIGVVAHHDCAGNPVDDEEQKRQAINAAKHLASRFTNLPVVALWVGPDWTVTEIAEIEPSAETAE